MLALNFAGHVVQVGPLHCVLQVQLQLGTNPETFTVLLLQSDMTQTREQLGYTPSYPALQEPQLLLALYRTAQMEQLAPPQELRQVQLHPLFVLPVTFTAFPVQLAWTVHVR